MIQVLFQVELLQHLLVKNHFRKFKYRFYSYLILSQSLNQINHFKVNGVSNRSEAYLVISCVTAQAPYYVHPNVLEGPDCKDGHYIYKLNDYDNTIELVI